MSQEEKEEKGVLTYGQTVFLPRKEVAWKKGRASTSNSKKKTVIQKGGESCDRKGDHEGGKGALACILR